MKIVQMIAAILLGLPLFIFGANYFVHLFPLPTDPSPGGQLLQSMRDGGLMSFIAASHVIAGVLLFVPQTRFIGAMLELPMTIGIASFHLSMSRGGIPMAAVMLLLNLGALANPGKWQALLAPGS